MKNFFAFVNISLFVVVLMFQAGCQRAEETGTSSVSFTFPRASSLGSQKVGTLSANPFPTGKTLCFGVSIKGPGIALTSDPCAPPLGVRAGFVAEGSTVSLDVPRGLDRTVEIYMYTAASGVDTSADQTTVAVNVEYPGDSANIASQLSLPASCLTSGGGNSGSGSPGYTIGGSAGGATSTNLKAKVRFGFPVPSQVATSPSGVKLYVK